MMSILKKFRERLLRAAGVRAAQRSIRRECDTLRRWAQRSDDDRYGV